MLASRVEDAKVVLMISVRPLAPNSMVSMSSALMLLIFSVLLFSQRNLTPMDLEVSMLFDDWNRRMLRLLMQGPRRCNGDESPSISTVVLSNWASSVMVPALVHPMK